MRSGSAGRRWLKIRDRPIRCGAPLAALESWKNCAAPVCVLIPQRDNPAKTQAGCAKDQLSTPRLSSHAIY